MRHIRYIAIDTANILICSIVAVRIDYCIGMNELNLIKLQCALISLRRVGYRASYRSPFHSFHYYSPYTDYWFGNG